MTGNATPNPDVNRPAHGAARNPQFVRRGDLYLPEGAATAADLRGHLSAERDILAVNYEHQWVSLAQDAEHGIRTADLHERQARVERSRRQRAKDDAEAAKLADLYRAAKSAGARARVRAEMYASAEMRALRITKMRKVTLLAGVPVLLAFAAWSTTGVQAGVVELLNLTDGDPSWWSAWGVEPALIAIVALIIVGRAMLRTSGGDTDWRATFAEWVALSTSLALNIAGVWDGSTATFGGAVAHSLGPIGAAGTAFLIGLFDSYLSRATPWEGAKTLADLGFDVEPDTRNDDAAQPPALPPVTQLGNELRPAQYGPVKELPAQPEPDRKVRKQSPPKARVKASVQPPTSGYAPGQDPGTLAALDVIEGRAKSNREAAQKHGVSEGTVRNRRNEINAERAATGAKPVVQPTVPMTTFDPPRPAAHTTANGFSHTPTTTHEEN